MNVLTDRLISEMQFWLRIFREHALFMRLGFPCNETQLINTAQDFENRYASLEKQALALTPSSDVTALARESLDLTLELIRFKTCVLDRLITCNLGAALYPLLIDHIRREAIRFVVNITRYLRGELMLPTEELLQDEIFWLRIMTDHSKFIAHLLDPSESGLIDQAQTFSDTFERLYRRAEDLGSMLEITPRPIPSLVRFSENTLIAGQEIRDFKAAATMLLKNCEALSITSPLLADHVRREAERFIQDIERDLSYLGQAPCPQPDFPPMPCPGEEEVDNTIQTEQAEIHEIPANNSKYQLNEGVQPVYRPNKTFFQAGQTQIKISFK